MILPARHLPAIGFPFRRGGRGYWMYESGLYLYSLAQTPGPDLACQDAVMESEAFISSETSCISTSRRARAG
jgi:hypothetical protein